MRLQGAVALVTGAGRGIGRRTTELLIQLGAQVAAIDINLDSLNSLKERSPSILPVYCDVSDPDQVTKAVTSVIETLGGIDILINNAGLMESAPLVNLLNREQRAHSAEQWRRVLDTNLSSVFYFSSNVADHLMSRRKKGVIINISSIAARGNQGQSAYSASKAGVEALTRVWGKELARFGIRCAAIAPGFMDTAGAHDALEERRLREWIAQVPLRRLGTIDEVVQTILFIIENDFINGAVIQLDGGLTI